MSIQSISSYGSLQQIMRTDFQNFRKDLQSVNDAEKSGNQDQVTLSEDALLKSMNQFQSDISGLQQANSNAGPPQTNSIDQGQSPVKDDLQNLLTDLNAVTDAKKSGNQDQIAAAEDAFQQALQQLQSDISGLQKGHHHHHHKVKGGPTAGATDDSSIASALTSTPYDNTVKQTQTDSSSVNIQA